MKILMITIDYPPNPIGGEGLAAEQTAKGLYHKGIDIELIAPFKKGAKEYDKKSPFKINRVKLYGSTFLTKIPSLIIQTRRLTKNFKGDLIYSLRPFFYTPRVKSILHIHILRYRQAVGCLKSRHFLHFILNLFYAPLDLFYIKKACSVITLTTEMKKDIISFSKVKKGKVQVLGNGIDPDQFNQTKINNDKTFKKILYAGRLDAAKGIFTLLNAFKDISEKNDGILLSLAGEGPLKNQIKEYCIQHNLVKSVFFLNKVPHEKMQELYSDHNLLVLPSFSEGFPLVPLEAMACGTPVISSDICAKLGQPTFKTGDSEDLINVVNKYLFDKNKLEQLSQKGIQIASNYSWDNIIETLIQLFKKEINKND